MAKSMDKVPQADGTYKWEMVEITQQYLAERAAKEEALANGTVFPGTEEAKPKTTRRKKSTKVEESTNS
tara:strand:- start:495 stop:701 length:207 start_codon:yes stop_codon:yes gene_type:complete